MLSLLHHSHRAPLGAMIAVPLAAAALAGGVYLAAATTASHVMATLSLEETHRHARAVEFEAIAARALAENRAARERCASLEADERAECAIVAARRQRIAFRGT